MRIQIFTGKNRKQLEEDINSFIAGKNVISITQSEYYYERQWNITMTILYE